MKRVVSPNLKFHVAVTATDSLYSKWQSRVMYYCYKKVKDLPGSYMGGFTWVLHSGQADNLIKEIPTFVVNPLPNGLDQVSCFFHLLVALIVLIALALSSLWITSLKKLNDYLRQFISWCVVLIYYFYLQILKLDDFIVSSILLG